MTRVAFDVSRMHQLSQKRGIGTYAQNLFESIKEHTDINISLIDGKTNYQQFDLIHFPYFDLFKNTLPFKLSKPAVVTIHDLIPIQFPKHYPPGIRGRINWHLQRLALKNVKSIIAVSEIVKKDIENILKINPEKITVVYSAPSENFKKIADKKILEDMKEKYRLGEDFVLYVGNVNWNKNILKMTQACVESGKKLVIIGSAFFDKSSLNHPEKKSFKAFLEKYSENSLITMLGYVPESDLVAIMNLAKCLLLVSFYEGFGLPILEAQSCGLPVITSKVSSMPEIGGKGAVLVDPEQIGEITEAINKVFSSETLREELIKEGRDNLKRFSWKKTAKETVKVYENALS